MVLSNLIEASILSTILSGVILSWALQRKERNKNQKEHEVHDMGGLSSGNNMPFLLCRVKDWLG